VYSGSSSKGRQNEKPSVAISRTEEGVIPLQGAYAVAGAAHQWYVSVPPIVRGGNVKVAP